MCNHDRQMPSAYLNEQRARLNPQGKRITDVMVEGTGIERSWLRIFRPPVEHGLFRVATWWAWLTLSVVGIVLLGMAVVRVL